MSLPLFLFFNVRRIGKSILIITFVNMAQRLIRILAGTVFMAIAILIFWLVVTGRGETTVPSGIDTFAIRGVDVSAHNGEIDFNAMARSGVDFVMIKATEGATHKDRSFVANLLGARRAGLRTGAYHFFRFDTPGYMQALNLLHSVRGRQLDLPVAIDVEEWTNPDDRPTEAVVAEIRAMASKLRKEGLDVIIYTNKDGYNRFVKGRLDEFPLWLCSFTPIDDGVDWTIWQYSHRGMIDGVDRMTDLNVYGGSREEWDSLFVKAPQ